MSDLQAAFNKLIEEQQELQTKFQKTAQALFKETVKEFFVKNSDVTAIVWTQYTPYFNDGEPCVFGVNDTTFTNAPDPDNIQWGEYCGDEETAADGSPIFAWSSWTGSRPIDFDTDACNHFETMICSSEMQDVMKTMFGDHVKVIATPHGFDVQDYEHD